MTTFSKRVRVKMMAGVSVSLVMTLGWTTYMAVDHSASASAAGVSCSRSAMSKDSDYTDDVYTATGNYGSLPSSITVTVTLEDDIITAVKVTPHATNPTSLDLQRRFADVVPAVVVGKHIDEVKVGRLAGSSGTPDGFNAAIERIMEQARIERTTSK